MTAESALNRKPPATSVPPLSLERFYGMRAMCFDMAHTTKPENIKGLPIVGMMALKGFALSGLEIRSALRADCGAAQNPFGYGCVDGLSRFTSG